MATYINKLASDKEIIDYLRNKYGVSDKPTLGSAQVIFRDGKFLNIESHFEALIGLTESGLIHTDYDVYDFIDTDSFDELGLIRCNSDIFTFVYACFPEIRPTEQQFEAFRKWLDDVDLKI